MARIAAWEFGEQSVFDGSRLYAEVIPEQAGRLRTGTLEITFTAERLHRSTIFAHGVPGRDPGAFTIVLTHTGAVSLSCTERSGAPFRLRTADGFAAEGERIQITLSTGIGGRLVVVNTDRRAISPDDPEAGFVAPLSLRVRCDLRGTHKFTFGAAAGGVAPFFRGRIHLATLSDSIDAPTLSAPTAAIHHVDFRARRTVAPRRVSSGEGDGPPRRPRPGERRFGPGAMRIATEDGDVALSKLKTGDRVLCREGGFATVEWVGRADLSRARIKVEPNLQPILIRKGAFGPELPEADMVLASEERILVPGAALRDPGPSEDGYLPAAEVLRRAGGVELDALGAAFVALFCDRTCAVQVNGIWVEALNPFDRDLNAVQRSRRDEMLGLYPDLADWVAQAEARD